MIHIHKRLPVKAPPEKVWAIVGDLTRAAEYVPGVVKARVDGTQRVCQDAAGNEIREEILDYSAAARSYSFRHTQSPLPVRNSEGRFVVGQADSNAVVEMEWRLDARSAEAELQLVPMIEGAADMTLDAIRRLAEAEA